MLKYQNRNKAVCRATVHVHKCRKCSHMQWSEVFDMQGWKMFTNAENVHTVERITKAVCRAGRCSQTPKMFQYAGLEDVHKRQKCSHTVTVTRTVCRAERCSQTPKMFTQQSGSLKRYRAGRCSQTPKMFTQSNGH